MLLRERKVTSAALKALRCSALVGQDWVLLHNWSHEQPLGRCPKPHKGRCPLTLQGADEKGRSPPLTRFWRSGLNTLPKLNFFAAFFLFLIQFRGAVRAARRLNRNLAQAIGAFLRRRRGRRSGLLPDAHQRVNPLQQHKQHQRRDEEIHHRRQERRKRRAERPCHTVGNVAGAAGENQR